MAKEQMNLQKSSHDSFAASATNSIFFSELSENLFLKL